MAVSEKAWGQQVEQLAKLYGWLYYHTHNSIHSAPGFPDYVFVHERGDGDLFFAELKTEKGKLSAAQERWLHALRNAGHEALVWRPSHFEAVHERLKRRADAR